MRLFLSAAICVAVSGVALGGAAFAQVVDTRPALQDRLIAVAAANGYGSEEAQLGLDSGVPEGKSVRYAFALKQGETYFVVGGCDDNCSNMALLMTDANSSGVAYSEDGNVIAHTAFSAGAHPSFSIKAKKTATYSIVINVQTCSGPSATCVAGAAVFHKAGSAAQSAPNSGKFSVSDKGAITLTDDFKDEMYCVWDTIDDDTASKAGEAGSKDKTNPEADAVIQKAKSTCASEYGWSEREGELALMMNSTQVVLDYALTMTDADLVDYDDIVDVRDTLGPAESAKFFDGTWRQDTDFVGKLDKGLKGAGLSDDMMGFGEIAVRASANQGAVMKAWVDFLRGK